MFLNINVKYYKVERDSIILPKPYFYVFVSGGKKTEENSTNLQDNLPVQPI